MDRWKDELMDGCVDELEETILGAGAGVCAKFVLRWWSSLDEAGLCRVSAVPHPTEESGGNSREQ